MGLIASYLFDFKPDAVFPFCLFFGCLKGMPFCNNFCESHGPDWIGLELFRFVYQVEPGLIIVLYFSLY
jgi:hypothetical protein